MTFQWGGLSDTADALGQQLPADAVRHHSSIEVVGYDRYEISRHEDGSVLLSTVLTERFTGAIDGIGYADHIRLVYPDGSGISTGIERVQGAVDGRTGSFILTAYGRNVGPREVVGAWAVQPDSGTAQLTGLRGRGNYTAVADADNRWHAEDEFVYWFAGP
jgi:hypothetical protein